ncbi:FtsX-like permease family protein [Bacillus toyonensis]|uniref:FtsX-like permease family protein n=1 Tax=Bacillus toyonensis TaxID=155322 RepID=UPI001C0D94EC|nr:FtsX-like permease family protein [Bacillus toyonensis]MBU4642796.1 FtsX-like permease family protein [Bacillus toyonensis]
MMYFKLSLRNVKRSFKDYAIYFMTITFAVCLFYSFNSLSAQQVMFEFSGSQSDKVKQIVDLIGFVSVFISIILAFLIIFANNFLIRRRKKELGMYMTLGMSKYKISKILVVETLLIGLISLGIGLGLGTLLSQGLSIVTAEMFKVNIKAYEFVFSMDATLKTIMYFGIIFIVVMIFNVIVINRYNLIDLLTASRKNQKIKLQKISAAMGVFVISLITLGTSYGMILKYGLFAKGSILWFIIVLGSLGTFLFFFSLSGFLLNLLKRNKKIYFKGINIFVLRQINSKVNSTFVSMTVICLMLFFTIGVLSTAFSYKSSLEKELDLATPYDASFTIYSSGESKKDLTDKFDVLNVKQYGDSVIFNKYQPGESIASYLEEYADEKSKKILKFDIEISIGVIKHSAYKELMHLQGKEPIDLKKNEALILSNKKNVRDTLKRYTDKNETINIRGKEYPIASKGFQFLSIDTSSSDIPSIIVVLPDYAVMDLPVWSSIMNIQYTGSSKKADEEIYNLLKIPEEKVDQNFSFGGVTKTLAYEDNIGRSTMVVYIGIYLGIVFLISSAAILALQQLSEASDNIERYHMLKRIGVTQKGIHKSIFKQVFIYFMMPLSLAIIHSIFGIKVVTDAIVTAGQAIVLIPSLITAGVIVVVYGGYFLATYSVYKSIVK